MKKKIDIAGPSIFEKLPIKLHPMGYGLPMAAIANAGLSSSLHRKRYQRETVEILSPSSKNDNLFLCVFTQNQDHLMIEVSGVLVYLLAALFRDRSEDVVELRGYMPSSLT